MRMAKNVVGEKIGIKKNVKNSMSKTSRKQRAKFSPSKKHMIVCTAWHSLDAKLEHYL